MYDSGGYMKILIKSNQAIQENLVFHNTTSEEAAQDIITNGFKGHEVDLSSSLEQVQGYGGFCVACKESELLSLQIADINQNYSFNLEDYPKGTQGLREPCHSDSSHHIYYIFDVSSLNSVTTRFRYENGDNPDKK